MYNNDKTGTEIKNCRPFTKCVFIEKEAAVLAFTQKYGNEMTLKMSRMKYNTNIHSVQRYYDLEVQLLIVHNYYKGYIAVGSRGEVISIASPNPTLFIGLECEIKKLIEILESVLAI